MQEDFNLVFYLQQEIEKFLENDVCALLPSQLAEACKQLVENDLKTLIQELVNKEDPKTVCKQLGVCSQKGMRCLYLCCRSLLLLVPAVRIYTLVHLLCELHI